MKAVIILFIVSCVILISSIINIFFNPAIHDMLYESMFAVTICEKLFEGDYWTNPPELYYLKKKNAKTKKLCIIWNSLL